MTKCDNCFNDETGLIVMAFKGRKKSVCKECYKEIFYKSIVSGQAEFIKDSDIEGERCRVYYRGRLIMEADAKNVSVHLN